MGTTKGHGFSGVIKRWNQHRLKETHGVGPVHREPGSMGANSSPSRVFKHKNLPGQYGVERVTIQNLEVVKVDVARNVLLIKGAIPGAKGSVVTVSTSVKSK
jgi:large subunit ribosomal protein L3